MISFFFRNWQKFAAMVLKNGNCTENFPIHQYRHTENFKRTIFFLPCPLNTFWLFQCECFRSSPLTNTNFSTEHKPANGRVQRSLWSFYSFVSTDSECSNVCNFQVTSPFMQLKAESHLGEWTVEFHSKRFLQNSRNDSVCLVRTEKVLVEWSGCSESIRYCYFPIIPSP